MNQAALHKLIAKKIPSSSPEEHFEFRLATNVTLLKELFFSVYPPESHTAVFEKLLQKLSKLFSQRPSFLKDQDLKRIEDNSWYQSHKIVGMQLYVDHFNKDLEGLIDKIPYLEDLGINFLHLMPITSRPKGENDGGYAVNSYTQIDKKYGTKKDFDELSKLLRQKGMLLMLDFVVNHTSNEHQWAKKAKDGQQKYQEYFYTYSDRHVPDAFEETLPEVFPETAPGNFTFVPEMQKWVMTVFNQYQWDLNYTNPEVFLAMLENLVELSNMGVDVVRFDALAFLWKKMGTNSQNLEEAHTIISLFRMCLQVIGPGTILLAEAIVAPQDIITYFGEGLRKGNECEVAYNASLMALLWNSIATKKTSLLHKTLFNIPEKPKEATWINYIRCHDDIGLGLNDAYIGELGWNPQGHRKFLLDYYCQNLDWSPAKGILFMYNPKTGDGRITGSAASLLGLEKAIEENDEEGISQSVKKIIMMHGIILSYGGLPMIYAGDEFGTLNDYTYLKDKTKKDDSRWVNRPHHDWKMVKTLNNSDTVHALIYKKIKNMIRIRQATPAFSDHGNNVQVHFAQNEHIFMYERIPTKKNGVLVICNFDEFEQVIDTAQVARLGYLKNDQYLDIITGSIGEVHSGFFELMPYQILWLKKWS